MVRIGNARTGRGIDTLNGSCYKIKFSKNGPGNGEVAEWLKAPLSKSGILAKTGIVGSNPTLSARGSFVGPPSRTVLGLSAYGTER